MLFMTGGGVYGGNYLEGLCIFFFFFFIKSLIFWVFSRGSITQFKLGYFVLVADFFFRTQMSIFLLFSLVNFWCRLVWFLTASCHLLLYIKACAQQVETQRCGLILAVIQRSIFVHSIWERVRASTHFKKLIRSPFFFFFFF